MWTGTNVFWLSIGCVMLGIALHQYWCRFQRWRFQRKFRKLLFAALPAINAATLKYLAELRERRTSEAEPLDDQEHDHQEHDHHGTTH